MRNFRVFSQPQQESRKIFFPTTKFLPIRKPHLSSRKYFALLLLATPHSGMGDYFLASRNRGRSEAKPKGFRRHAFSFYLCFCLYLLRTPWSGAQSRKLCTAPRCTRPKTSFDPIQQTRLERFHHLHKTSSDSYNPPCHRSAIER
jgi:hypothetical protein